MALMGEIQGTSPNVSKDRVSRGVEINQVFNQKMEELFTDCIQSFSEQRVNTILANLSGFQNQVLPNQLAFEITVGQLVEGYKTPLKETAEIIKKILIKGIILLLGIFYSPSLYEMLKSNSKRNYQT